MAGTCACASDRHCLGYGRYYTCRAATDPAAAACQLHYPARPCTSGTVCGLANSQDSAEAPGACLAGRCYRCVAPELRLGWNAGEMSLSPTANQARFCDLSRGTWAWPESLP